MRRSMIAILIASFTCALLAGNASANRISTSDLDIEWRTFVIFRTGLSTIRCNATLLGNFHSSTISKTAGALVGVITHAVLAEPCQALDETLPWHLTYRSFDGILPTISRVWFLLVGAAAQATSEGSTCLMRTETGEPAAIGATIEAEGEAPTITFESSLEIDLSGGFLCDLAGDVSLEGEGEYEGGESDTNRFTLI